MGEGSEADSVPDASGARDGGGLSLDTQAACARAYRRKARRAMAAPENAAMRKSTKRFIADEDLLPLAEDDDRARTVRQTRFQILDLTG